MFFVLMTVVSERYISKKVDVVKPDFIYERRKARQANIVAPTPRASRTYLLQVERSSEEQVDTFARPSGDDHSVSSYYKPQTVV